MTSHSFYLFHSYIAFIGAILVINRIFVHRYGQFGVCNRISSNIRDRVSSEHLHFWLAGLQEISIAEANLQLRESDKLLNRISNSITNYCKATSSFKVCSCSFLCVLLQRNLHITINILFDCSIKT